MNPSLLIEVMWRCIHTVDCGACYSVPKEKERGRVRKCDRIIVYVVVHLFRGTNRAATITVETSASWSWRNVDLMKLRLPGNSFLDAHICTLNHTHAWPQASAHTPTFGFWSHKCTRSHFGESRQSSYADTFPLWPAGPEECHVLWGDVTRADCQYHLHILKFGLQNVSVLFVLLSPRQAAEHNVILKLPYITLPPRINYLRLFSLCR